MEDNNNILQEEFVSETQNQSPELFPQQTYQPRPPFELAKSDIVFALFALAASVFTSIFGIFGGFALGYLISSLLLIVTFSLYLIKSKSIRLFSLLCIILSIGNSIVFVTTTNTSVKAFGVLLSALLTMLGIHNLALGKTVGNRETLGIFYSAASTMGNIGVSLKSLFSNSNGNKKSIGKIMFGLLCALPVLVIIVPLLLSDDAFSGMMSSIFVGLGNSVLIVFKIVFGVGLSMLVVSYGLSLKFGRFSNAKESNLVGIDNTYIISFLSAISVCYLLYLFSQLAYFFSAFSGFLPNQDIGYSEYARKGFFEMCIIAVINLTLVFLSMLFSKKQDGRVCAGIKIMTTFIAVFTLIIIATAISKMVLYIQEYGMTVLRLTTSAFMLFLAVSFLAVILRIYLNKINIVKTTLVTAGIIVLLLGTVNVNGVCAKYNYEAYKSQKLHDIDVEAIYNLGDEGIPYLAKLACSKKTDIAKDAQHYLAKAYIEDYFEDMDFAEGFDVQALRERQKYKGFSFFNLPRNKAYNTLYRFLEDNPQFDQKCLEYQENYCSPFDLFWG